MMLSSIWQLTCLGIAGQVESIRSLTPQLLLKWTPHHLDLQTLSLQYLKHCWFIFFRESRSYLPYAAVVCWAAFFFLQAVSFQVFLAFLDDSHLPEQKQHCSSRGIGGRCERMCKTKCTHAKGRWWSWGLDLPRWTHGLSHFSGSLQWLL